LLIRGEGKVFSSGRDISNIDVDTDDAHAFLAEVFAPVFQAIRALPIPVIAQVQGAALGLGFGIAAAADIIYAAVDAEFGSPFAAIGAMLASGGHHVFLARVGYHRTMDLIVTGDFMTGAEAAAAGIVSRAVPAAELSEFVESKLEKIVTGPAEAFALEQGFVQKIADERPCMTELLAVEAAMQESARQTPDYAEGFRAVQERRSPNFVKFRPGRPRLAGPRSGSAQSDSGRSVSDCPVSGRSGGSVVCPSDIGPAVRCPSAPWSSVSWRLAFQRRTEKIVSTMTRAQETATTMPLRTVGSPMNAPTATSDSWPGRDETRVAMRKVRLSTPRAPLP